MDSSRRLRLFLLLMVAGCSGSGDGGAGITDTDPLGPAVSIELKASAAAVQVGGTVQLTATAKDASGRTVPDATFAWSSDARLLAIVSNTGLISGISPGNPVLTATLPSRRSKSGTLAVNAPPRPAGSVFKIGEDSVFQNGSMLHLSTLEMSGPIAGSRERVGIMHIELPNASLNPPVLRRSFPQFSSITECSDGDVYGASYATTQDGVHIWKIDPRTAVITMKIRDPDGGETWREICAG